MNKFFKSYLSIWVILLVVFNAAVFVPIDVAGMTKFNSTFWMAYGFITLAFIGQLVISSMAFGAENTQKFFYKIPLIRISWTGLILTLIFGVLCMLAPYFPSWIAIVICLAILVFYAIALIKANAAAEIVSEIDDKINAKTEFIKILTGNAVDLMNTAKTPALKAEAKKVYEAVRYSDPMSNAALFEIETAIENNFSEFASAVNTGNVEKASAIGAELISSVNFRNIKAKAEKRTEAYSKAEQNEISAEKHRSKNTVATLVTVLAVLCISIVLLLNFVVIPNNNYKSAVALMNVGKYEDAIAAFEALDGYIDSEEKIQSCKTYILDGKYNAAVALMHAGKYDEAITAFEALGSYKDSAAQIENCEAYILDGKYNAAVALMDAWKYREAMAAFSALGEYKDSEAQIENCIACIELEDDYNSAVALMNEGKYDEAIAAFEALAGFKDSAAQIKNCETHILDGKYDAAVALMEEGKYQEAIEAFSALGEYKDSAEQIKTCMIYALGGENADIAKLIDEGKYGEAIAAFNAGKQ